jgi:hypothetical protein
MAGRPSKLDSETVDVFLDTLKGTGNVRTSAERACIGVTTVYRWLELGNKAKSGPFWEFWNAFWRAKGDFKAQNQITHHRWAIGGIIKEPKCHVIVTPKGVVDTNEIERDEKGEIVWIERYFRPDLDAIWREMKGLEPETSGWEPQLNIENPIDVGISKEEKHERLSILAQAVKILRDLGVEWEDPAAIEVRPVEKIE